MLTIRTKDQAIGRSIVKGWSTSRGRALVRSRAKTFSRIYRCRVGTQGRDRGIFRR